MLVTLQTTLASLCRCLPSSSLGLRVGGFLFVLVQAPASLKPNLLWHIDLVPFARVNVVASTVLQSHACVVMQTSAGIGATLFAPTAIQSQVWGVGERKAIVGV